MTIERGFGARFATAAAIPYGSKPKAMTGTTPRRN